MIFVIQKPMGISGCKDTTRNPGTRNMGLEGFSKVTNFSTAIFTDFSQNLVGRFESHSFGNRLLSNLQ